MDIVISKTSEVPIYQQVYNEIEREIMQGRIKGDEPLPSIRNVAKHLNISIITIKSAYELLEREGYIYTKQGVGCFVSPYHKVQLEEKKMVLAKEKLGDVIKYFKSLNITKEQLIRLIENNY